MKNIWLLPVLFLVPLAPLFASTVVRTGDSVTVAENQTVEGNYYAIGGSVALSGIIMGDAAVLGGNVTINGTITNDLLVVAGTVSQHASATEDVRIIAVDTTISEPIKGSLVVAGGRLTILSTATIGGDVLFYGGEAIIDGAVKGKVMGTAERMRINGAVESGVDVKVHSLTLGEQANITGDVQYTSPGELVRATGAVVTGSVIPNDTVEDAAMNQRQAARQAGIYFLISLFATLSLYLLFRKQVEELAASTVVSLPRFGLIGFAALVVVPIATIILLVSVLGILIGLIGLFVLLALCIVAITLMNVVAGVFVAKLITKKAVVTVPTIIVGAATLHLLLWIPVIGPLVLLSVFLITLGALVARLHIVAR